MTHRYACPKVCHLILPALLCCFTANAADWRPSGAPELVLAGVENGQPRFVCRAGYDGGLHPGKTVNGKCNISWGGNEISIDRYELLMARGHWGRWDHKNYERALVAGHESNGSPLYLCRTEYSGATHPGKVVDGRCNIGWGGHEVALPDFELFYDEP